MVLRRRRVKVEYVVDGEDDGRLVLPLGVVGLQRLFGGGACQVAFLVGLEGGLGKGLEAGLAFGLALGDGAVDALVGRVVDGPDEGGGAGLGVQDVGVEAVLHEGRKPGDRVADAPEVVGVDVHVAAGAGLVVVVLVEIAERRHRQRSEGELGTRSKHVLTEH